MDSERHEPIWPWPADLWGLLHNQDHNCSDCASTKLHRIFCYSDSQRWNRGIRCKHPSWQIWCLSSRWSHTAGHLVPRRGTMSCQSNGPIVSAVTIATVSDSPIIIAGISVCTSCLTSLPLWRTSQAGSAALSVGFRLTLVYRDRSVVDMNWLARQSSYLSLVPSPSKSSSQASPV